MTYRDDLRKLIYELERHLQKLKEKKARLGINTPPGDLLEIDDYEAELEQKRAELAALEAGNRRQPASSIAGEISDLPPTTIAKPTTKSKQPRIDRKANIHLTPEIELVLQDMFPGFDRLQVEVEFGRGRTNTRVFKVRPIESGSGKDHLPVVVKVGPVSLIQQEWQAYQAWVAGTMAAIARLDNLLTIPEGSSWAGLRYTLAGGDVHNVESLLDYCRRPEVMESQQVLERLFERMGERWWLDNRGERIKMQAEYDKLLPVNLLIEPLDTPPAGEVHSITPEAQVSSAMAVGDYVHLRNFVVTEVEVGQHHGRVTLNLPQAGSGQPADSYRLRLDNVPDIEQYTEGDPVASLYGVITTTQDEMLIDIANRALRRSVDLTGDRLNVPSDAALSLPTELPNPLAAYQNILQEFVRIRISTIHGDLNLENVLVDPGIGEAYLIDFAAARKGHALHDLLHLEQSVVTQLLPPTLAQARLPAQTIWTVYWELHRMTVQAGQDGPHLPHPALKKPFTILATIRNAARGCLFRPNDWAEYYQGLILYLLGALKFRDLDEVSEAPLPKQIAFWGAASIKALLGDDTSGLDLDLGSQENSIKKATEPNTERNRTMTEKDDKPSGGVSIGSISGNIQGSIIAGGNVSNAKVIASDQHITSDGVEPTATALKQLLTEIHQQLAEIAAQQDTLQGISSVAHLEAQSAAERVKTAAEQVEPELKPDQAESLERSLQRASHTLGGILDEAKSVAQKAGAVGQAVQPIVAKLEPLLEQLGLATTWLVRLWL